MYCVSSPCFCHGSMSRFCDRLNPSPGITLHHHHQLPSLSVFWSSSSSVAGGFPVYVLIFLLVFWNHEECVFNLFLPGSVLGLELALCNRKSLMSNILCEGNRKLQGWAFGVFLIFLLDIGVFSLQSLIDFLFAWDIEVFSSAISQRFLFGLTLEFCLQSFS